MSPEMLGERLESGVRVLTRRDTHRDAGFRRRHELVRRFGEPRRVDPENRDRWLHPHTVGDAALADELRAGPEADLLPKLGLLKVQWIRLSARDPRDGDVTALVVECGECLRKHGEGVGDGPAEFAGMHRVIEGPHFDIAGDDAAERDREARLAGAPVPRVRENDRVGAKLAAVLIQELSEIR